MNPGRVVTPRTRAERRPAYTPGRRNARLQTGPALNEDFIVNVSKKNRWVTSGYLRCTVGHGDSSGVNFADLLFVNSDELTSLTSAGIGTERPNFAKHAVTRGLKSNQ
jgi:hypothetical protein